MARKIYPRTDETFKVLSGFESAIAREMECDPSYINKVKNGVEQDRYPQFREIFRAACNVQAPTELWLHDLTAIWVKSRIPGFKDSELSAKLLEKIKTDSEETAAMVDAIADGTLDKAECYRVLSQLEKSESVKKRLKEIILHRLGEITEKENN